VVVLEPVIRAAQLAPSRTRLSGARCNATAGVAARESAPTIDPTRALREDIERQLRHEQAAQRQMAYEEEFERARREGLSAALDQARAETSAESQRTRERLREQVQQVLLGLERAHELALTKLESSVGDVAFAALCKLIGQESASKILMSGVVQQVCARLRGDTAATLRVSPRDIDTLRHLLQEDPPVQSLQLELIVDESLALGGCVAEAASGTYDGGLEAQLRRLHTVICATQG
jgi:flagellar assembly protein FliH